MTDTSEGNGPTTCELLDRHDPACVSGITTTGTTDLAESYEAGLLTHATGSGRPLRDIGALGAQQFR